MQMNKNMRKLEFMTHYAIVILYNNEFINYSTWGMSFIQVREFNRKN